jgi:hemin uptake protein HemP
VSSAELLGEQRELRILHQGEHYVLRLTRLGKLILTK